MSEESVPTTETKAGQQGERRNAGGGLITDMLHLAQSRVSQLALKFLVGLAAARIWGAEALGIIALALVIPGMVVDALDLGTLKSLPYLLGRGDRPRQQIMSNAFTMWILVTLASSVVALLILFSPVTREVPPLWGVLGVLTIGPALMDAYSRSFAIGVQRLEFFKHQVWLREPVTLAVVLVGGLVLGLSTQGPNGDGWVRLIASVLGFIVAAGIGIRLMRQYVTVRPGWNLSVMRALVGKSIVFGLGVWAMRMNYQIGLLLLGIAAFNISAANLGNYRAATTVAMLLWQIPGMLAIALYSRGVAAKDPAYQSYRAALLGRVSTIASLPFAGALFVLAPFLVPLVYGPQFTQAASLVQVLIPGMVGFFGARAFEADLSAKGRPLLILAVMGPLALFNAGLGALLIPRLDVYGAAWAATISYLLGTLVLGALFARVTGMRLSEVFVPRLGDFRLVRDRLMDFWVRSIGRRRSRRQEEPAPVEEEGPDLGTGPDA